MDYLDGVIEGFRVTKVYRIFRCQRTNSVIARYIFARILKVRILKVSFYYTKIDMYILTTLTTMLNLFFHFTFHYLPFFVFFTWIISGNFFNWIFVSFLKWMGLQWWPTAGSIEKRNGRKFSRKQSKNSIIMAANYCEQRENTCVAICTKINFRH